MKKMLLIPSKNSTFNIKSITKEIPFMKVNIKAFVPKILEPVLKTINHFYFIYSISKTFFSRFFCSPEINVEQKLHNLLVNEEKGSYVGL